MMCRWTDSGEAETAVDVGGYGEILAFHLYCGSNQRLIVFCGEDRARDASSISEDIYCKSEQ